MTAFDKKLKTFERRVRWLKAWRGVALGGSIGATASFVWTVLDYFRVFYTEWLWLAGPVLAGALIGGLWGLFGRIPKKALADSIDRRATLENRLGTALDEKTQQSSLSGAQSADASQHLLDLKPKTVYPFKFTRWHSGLVAMSVVAASIFLLGNSPIFMSNDKKEAQKELKKAAEAVERIAKPAAEREESEMGLEKKELAKKLEKFADELKRGRMTKEEALQKADELNKEAEDLARKDFEKSERSLEEAKSAFEKMKRSELEKKGLQESDLEVMKMSPEQLKQERKATDAKMTKLSKEMQDLLKKMEAGKNEKGEPLSQKEMDALQKQLEGMKEAMEKLRKLMEKYKLSEEAMDSFRKMMETKEWKELMEMPAKLQKAQEQGKQGNQGKPPEISEEEFKEMMKRLEELAEKLKDDKFMKEFIEQLKKSLKECKGGCMGLGMCLGLLPFGMPAIGQDNFYKNMGVVPQTKDEKDIKSGIMPMSVTGEKRDEGEEVYIEIKGPAKLGERSSMPYQKVLPKYKRRAEEALGKQKIPAEHQKRVKEYFNSLQGGG